MPSVQPTGEQLVAIDEAIAAAQERLREGADLAAEAFRVYAAVYGPGSNLWAQFDDLYRRARSAAGVAGTIARELAR